MTRLRVIVTVSLSCVLGLAGALCPPAAAQTTESRSLTGTDKDHTVPREFVVGSAAQRPALT